MNTLLWIIQGLLALVFFVTGFPKLVQTKEQLVTQMDALEDLPLTQIRMIGYSRGSRRDWPDPAIADPDFALVITAGCAWLGVGNGRGVCYEYSA